MVPFLAVFALWHPADSSSQLRASPGGCESPWPQLGCLFSAGHSAGEKQAAFSSLFGISQLCRAFCLAWEAAEPRGGWTREVSPSFLSAQAGSARLQALVNVFCSRGQGDGRGGGGGGEHQRKAGAPRHPGRERQPGVSLAGE